MRPPLLGPDHCPVPKRHQLDPRDSLPPLEVKLQDCPTPKESVSQYARVCIL